MHFRHVKGLIWALAVSGFLNIILLTSLFYWMFKERSPALYCEQKLVSKYVQQGPINADDSSRSVLLNLQNLSYEQLLLKLKSTVAVDNGYCERDLALSCLVAKYDFDLVRALKGSAYLSQERILTYGDGPGGLPASIKVYSGLEERHFSSIIAFAETERWPLTPKGLFLRLQQNKQNPDKSLVDAFTLTAEFKAIEPLFKRSLNHLDNKEILDIALQGDWPLFAAVSAHQRQFADFSDRRRQNVLLEYIKKGSQTAAYALLKQDEFFARTKLEDQQVLSVLSLLSEKTPESHSYARSLLISPRSDAVLQLAAKRLYEYAGEDIPEKFHYSHAIVRFTPSAAGQQQKNSVRDSKKPESSNQIASARPLPKVKKLQVKPKADRLYIVQDGDNLWKLSRRFNVEVDVLKSYNKLKSDALAPGSAIRIPSS